MRKVVWKVDTMYYLTAVTELMLNMLCEKGLTEDSITNPLLTVIKEQILSVTAECTVCSMEKVLQRMLPRTHLLKEIVFN